ncbi:hypothetical protein ACFLZQ_01765 [Thermodesulfobacteriota bacterium]
MNELLVIWLDGVGIIIRGSRGDVNTSCHNSTIPPSLKVVVPGGNVDYAINPLCSTAKQPSIL